MIFYEVLLLVANGGGDGNQTLRCHRAFIGYLKKTPPNIPQNLFMYQFDTRFLSK